MSLNTNLKIIIGILRIIFGLLFIFSGIVKLVDLNLFQESVIKFNLINENLIKPVIYGLPFIEIILGLAVVVNFRTSFIMQIIVFMLALFTAVVVAKIFEGAQINCSCFGEFSSSNIDSITVIRNIVLMIWAILLIFYYEENNILKHDSNNNRLKGKERFWETVKSVLLMTMFFFLTVQTLIFAIQNKQLKIRLGLLLTDRDVLELGDTVKAINLIDLNENISSINFPSKNSTLIYILSTSCSPCTQNIPNWNFLTSELKNENLRIIGVALNSLDDVKKYQSIHNPGFPISVPQSEQFKIDYKAFITPQTILIDKDAIVIKSIQGVITKNTLSELIEIK